MPCLLAPAPAALYIPWPWQAPINWLIFALLLALIAWSLVREWRKATAQAAGTASAPAVDGRLRWHELPLWFRSISALSSLMAFFIVVLVVFPSFQRNEVWYHSQFSHFTSGNQDCSLSASNLFTISSANMQTTMVTNFIALGLAALPWLLFLLARTSVTWRHARPVRLG